MLLQHLVGFGFARPVQSVTLALHKDVFAQQSFERDSIEFALGEGLGNELLQLLQEFMREVEGFSVHVFYSNHWIIKYRLLTTPITL